MAIIDSVVMGSARNKVGEITLSVIKGRTIARKYQRDVHNPNTPAQERQRNKMHNNVLVFQLVKNVIEKGFLQKGKYQSTYNAFVSANIADMSTEKDFTAEDVLQSMGAPLNIAKGSLKLVNPHNNGIQNYVTFDGAEKEMKIGDKLVIFGILSGGIIAAYETVTITQNMIEDTSYYSTIQIGTVNWVGAYWYTADQKKSSNGILTEG
jgi:hypothetical protein